MRTPFDAAIDFIARARYHNHRLEAHSDIVSDGILEDLRERCPAIRRDLDGGVVRVWKNVSSPGDRERSLPLRGSAQTHLVAYDSVLLVPVYIDNVYPPALPRPNDLDVDVDAEYDTMIQRTCSAYTARWHM